jgi:hypothetical protein
MSRKKKFLPYAVLMHLHNIKKNKDFNNNTTMNAFKLSGFLPKTIYAIPPTSINIMHAETLTQYGGKLLSEVLDKVSMHVERELG